MAAPTEGSDTLDLVESKWVKARDRFMHLQELDLSLGGQRFGTEEYVSGGQELKKARVVRNLIGHELQGIHHEADRQLLAK